ncbi:MAG: hypothetical protein HY927_06830 [Elusimicrobia bacterium]|nr:hypothetical protein [Elusimicrobiota bacterium]
MNSLRTRLKTGIPNRILAAFALSIGAGLVLRANVIRTPFLFQYDPHLDHIREIHAHYAALRREPSRDRTVLERIGAYGFHRFLLTTKSPLAWHPPAHHIACALLAAAAPRHALLVLKTYVWACNILTIFLALMILRHFFRDSPGLILLGLSLILFLPAHITFCNLMSNDVTLSVLCALFLYLSLRWEIDDKGLAAVVSLSLLSGLLLLTKYTGVVCFLYLNALLLAALLRRRIGWARLLEYLAWVWGINMLLAYWFYRTNHGIHGTAFSLPGVSQLRQHSFLSFKPGDLLTRPVNTWHESASVLTGFYASFLSFDCIHNPVQEMPLRNAVFLSSSVVLATAALGLASSLRQARFALLNVFWFVAVASTARFLWRYDLSMGPLKACYVMFLAPLLCVYLAEGLRTLRSSSRPLFTLAAAVLAATGLLVSAYCLRFDFTTWWS